MDIEVHISFDINSVFVQSGDLNKRFANVIAIEKSLNKVVAIGETYQEVAERDPERWEKIKDSIVLEPIFDPKKFNPEHIYWATRMFASNIHHELRGNKLFDRIICNVNIPKYELFKERGKEHFEMRLERWPRLRTLTVNGITEISKGWQYNLAEFSLHWAWLVLLAALVVAFTRRPDLFFGIFGPLIEKLSFGIILVFAFLVLAVIWVTEIAWMVVMQRFLPKQTLQRMFSVYQQQFSPSDKMSLSKLFANWILGKDQ